MLEHPNRMSPSTAATIRIAFKRRRLSLTTGRLVLSAE
jgi:hypothetical protein